VYRHSLRLAGLMILAVAIFALISTSRAQTTSGGRSEVTIAATIDINWPHFYVASAKGLDGAENLKIALANFPSGRLAMDALFGGKAQFSLTSDYGATLAMIQGLRPLIIATLTNYDGYRIVAWKDVIRSPSDLKGKRVGTHVGTSAQYFLARFLLAHGLRLEDVNQMNVAVPDGPIALEGRSVDALATWEPGITNAERRLGDRATVLPGRGVYNIHYVLLTTPEYARTNPDMVRRVLRVALAAERYMLANKEESIKILTGLNGQDPGLLSRLWDEHHFSANLTPGLVELMVVQRDWAIETQTTQRPETLPIPRSFVATEFLRALRPAAVTLK
jgi:ABC-type nitrate/sulfonate/bicarbonate transport system substrate-binding protein